MVDSVTINKFQARDRLVVDTDVWMQHPDDHDFRPRLILTGTTLALHQGEDLEPVSTIELDEAAMGFAERDRMAELRVKFQVRGMHGKLTHRHPVLADGAANVKKLAEPRWKTLLPIGMA